MNEIVMSYEFTDAGYENQTWNGQPRFWITERLSRDGGRTTYNGKTVLGTQLDIDTMKTAGFKVVEDTHISD